MAVLTGWMRLAILLTVFWITGFAAYLQPWEGKTNLFVVAGIGPVAACWGVFWVWLGYKKYQR